MDCVFCKIAKGELSCYKIYEDKDTLAFLDREQAVEGHTLVIPKQHHQDIFALPPTELQHVMEAVQKTAAKLKERLGCDGVNLLNASGKAAQQSVFHFHMHIIPRWNDDGIDAWPKFPHLDVDKDALSKRLGV